MNKLTFAIQMETDGERYYLKQAKENENSALSPVFKILAAAENKHAELLRNMAQGNAIAPFTETSSDMENLFSHLADFKSKSVNVPDQLAVYLFVLEMEQKSIDLYQEMLQAATKAEDQQFFSLLVKQEQSHYKLFDELVALLKRPKNWVEAAEFGPRIDY
jgi:rubrerythrin